jgi:hypothetical protein
VRAIPSDSIQSINPKPAWVSAPVVWGLFIRSD